MNVSVTENRRAGGKWEKRGDSLQHPVLVVWVRDVAAGFIVCSMVVVRKEVLQPLVARFVAPASLSESASVTETSRLKMAVT